MDNYKRYTRNSTPIRNHGPIGRQPFVVYMQMKCSRYTRHARRRLLVWSTKKDSLSACSSERILETIPTSVMWRYSNSREPRITKLDPNRTCLRQAMAAYMLSALRVNSVATGVWTYNIGEGDAKTQRFRVFDAGVVFLRRSLVCRRFLVPLSRHRMTLSLYIRLRGRETEREWSRTRYSVVKF